MTRGRGAATAVRHRWLGPKVCAWRHQRAAAWAAVCTCKWVGPERPNKKWAREDHVKHAIKEGA